MEKIQDWLDNNGAYNTGVILYSTLPNPNRNLLRLFIKKQTAYNLAKLKQELKKHVKTPLKIKVLPPKVIRHIDIIIDSSPKTPSTSIDRNFKRVTLNMLPAELHQVFIDQKTKFLTNCALKFKLNGLRFNATAKALKIILEIDRNFDFIDLAWKHIDYYLENKVLLPTETDDYTDLNSHQLFRVLGNKETSISKVKKRIAAYKADIKTANGRALQNLKIKLGKSEQLLFKNEQNVLKIKGIIDGQ